MSRTDRSIHKMPVERVAAREAAKASGRAGTHADRRTKRVRTRGAAKAHAMREWGR